ncbi:glucosyltransferase [Candidatus Omnitrophus magneticus]|uniref:Glucosyltransferase n=1 Tax=Candidatus Omnitrophus magneticus TaxID=1609969 RepID=A0A0F0CRD8_9BACT|nr:glucosyltransferase [Candidatus Omnitrophus magneticus]
MSKKRVLIFSNWAPPIKSGSSFYADSLAKTIRAKGDDVVFVTLAWGKNMIPELSNDFIVYRLPVLRLPKLPIFYNSGLMGFSFNLGNYNRLKQIIKKHSIDIIHHVNHIFDSTILVTNTARATRVPIVGSITTPIQHQHPLMQKIMSMADVLTVGTFGVKKWDGIISLDKMVHEYVGSVYGKKTQTKSIVIPFGARLDSMAQYKNNSVKKSAVPLILMVGHIHPFRNPVNLIRALPYVLKVFPSAKIILAGRLDINEPKQIRDELGLTPEQVNFLGETNHDKIISLMKESHVFASWATGPFVGLGTAAMEAMLCGTPVVNDFPENLFGENKLKNGTNIILVDSKNPEKIGQELINLLKSPELMKKIGDAGKHFMNTHLNWDTIGDNIEKFYDKIIAEYKK